MAEFDFLGLFLIVVGIVLVLLGFNESETSCGFILLSSCRDGIMGIDANFLCTREFEKDYYVPCCWICVVGFGRSERVFYDPVTNCPSAVVQGQFKVSLQYVTFISYLFFPRHARRGLF